MTLTVACILSKPQSGPAIYTRAHVERLGAMVAEHMVQPYKFVCVDDSPWPGYWAKISLWEPGRFEGRVLYLDLDVTVVGGLDDLADHPAPFVVIKDWQSGRFNSSVMAWDANGWCDHIWFTFDIRSDAVMERVHGDQAWVWSQMHDVSQTEMFPSSWCRSYKRHIRPRLDGTIPKDCRVIVWHGLPKPWSVEDG